MKLFEELELLVIELIGWGYKEVKVALVEFERFDEVKDVLEYDAVGQNSSALGIELEPGLHKFTLVELCLDAAPRDGVGVVKVAFLLNFVTDFEQEHRNQTIFDWEGYEIDDGNNDIHINLVVFCVLTFRKYGLKSTPQEADQNLTHNDYHLFIEEKAKKRPEEPAEIEDQEKEPAGPVEFFVNEGDKTSELAAEREEDVDHRQGSHTDEDEEELLEIF